MAARRGSAVPVIFATVIACLPVGPVHAESVATIHRFSGGADGQYPVTGLVPGDGGALYGATSTTVYQLRLDARGDWHVTPIFAVPFQQAITSLVFADGVLFGILGNGGKPCPQDSNVCGAIVELTPPTNDKASWTETPIYDFKGGKDGVHPAGITIDAKGVIYGTTISGGGSFTCGSDNNIPDGCGTLFNLAETEGKWKETVLHRFQGGSDGAEPFAAPSLDEAGNIYTSTDLGFSGSMTTAADKKPSCEGYGGVLARIRDAFEALLYQLQCGQKPASGAFPEGVLLPPPVPIRLSSDPRVADPEPAKALIGTATGGGNVDECPLLGNNGCGTVFLLTRPADGKTPWDETVLHVFSDTDGNSPQGYLTAVGDDAVYGVTPDGGIYNAACGANGCGTIYQLVTEGSGWKWGGTVHKFVGGAGGFQPVPQLTLFNGMILGTNGAGGSSKCPAGCGTIFAITP
jgi:hypothetical protein